MSKRPVVITRHFKPYHALRTERLEVSAQFVVIHDLVCDLESFFLTVFQLYHHMVVHLRYINRYQNRSFRDTRF